jgi:Putative DNA-binding domain
MDSAELAELLNSGEANWLDWKRQLDPVLEYQDKSSKDWDKGRGTLLRDIAALANAISSEENRYLIRGIEDGGHQRTIVGISKHFDDADFQTWVRQVFDPPIQFHYEELEAEPGKIVGVFEITFDPKGPHVAIQDVGPLRKGQIWLRRGSQNDFAKRADLDVLIKTEPVELQRLFGDSIDHLTKHYSPREVVFPSFGDQYIKCLQGYELAFWPGTRQEVHIRSAHLQRPELIAMLKPIQET